MSRNGKVSKWFGVPFLSLEVEKMTSKDVIDLWAENGKKLPKLQYVRSFVILQESPDKFSCWRCGGRNALCKVWLTNGVVGVLCWECVREQAYFNAPLAQIRRIRKITKPAGGKSAKKRKRRKGHV